MADTFTDELKVRLIQTGAYNNTWGAVQSSDQISLLTKAIAGLATITLSGSTYSLPAMSEGAASDSRMAVLRFIGSPSGAVTVTVPGSVGKKIYFIDNRCGQTITLTYGSGTTASFASGVVGIAICDGSNVQSTGGGTVNADTLGGVAAANYARRDVANVFAKVNSYPWQTVTEAPNTVVDASAGNHQRLTLTGNRNMDAPTGMVDGQVLVLQVVQDGVGGRSISAWNTAFIFENGLTPTLSSTALAVDLFVMYYDASTGKWLVTQFPSISPTSGASYNLTLRGGVDVRLADILGTVGSAATVNITIERGAVFEALSTGSYALDLYNALPAGSTVNLTNLGAIIGRGGAGGDGGFGGDCNGGAGMAVSASSGEDGGGALRGPGSGITFNVTNGAGRIWGGGGGGGGGGSSNATSNAAAAGGGGGGGAGGGVRGNAGAFVSTATGLARGANGTSGSSGVNGINGTGGAGASSGSGTGGAGGDGGSYGNAGSSGVNPTSFALDSGNGPGGAAGKAIELVGGTVNFVSGNGSPNVLGAVS